MSSLLKTESLKKRFFKKVIISDDGDCWEWTACKTKAGYGAFSLNGKSVLAHRLSYSFVNKISNGKVIDHICRNRSCVNPNHLREVKQSENALENSIGQGAKNKIKTHCSRGHDLSESSLLILKNGAKRRVCKPCHALRSKQYRDRRNNV